MYIPEERALRLLEVQFTILPEDEWLIGLSDLTYFQGIGFSMPISFDFEEVFSGEKPIIISTSDGVILSSGNDEFGLENAEECSSQDLGIPIILQECDFRNGIEIAEESNPFPEDELQRPKLLMHDTPQLYAFLPGLFYCSQLGCTVDGILVEVLNSEILGMNVANFRAESVRTYDIKQGISIDGKGNIEDVDFNMSTTGRFATGISEELIDYSQLLAFNSMQQSAYSIEIDIAIQMAMVLEPEQVKRAFVSGPIFTGQLMTLLHDIEKKGLDPRNRLYVRNREFPNGVIVEVEYSSYTAIRNLYSEGGIQCPYHIGIESQIRNLSFARLIEPKMEVDIERAVLDAFDFLKLELGTNPSKDMMLGLIFSGGRVIV